MHIACRNMHIAIESILPLTHTRDEEEEHVRRRHAGKAGIVQREHFSMGSGRDDGRGRGSGRQRPTDGGRRARIDDCYGNDDDASTHSPDDGALMILRVQFAPAALAYLHRPGVYSALRTVQESFQERQVCGLGDDERPSCSHDLRAFPQDDVRGGSNHQQCVQMLQSRRSGQGLGCPVDDPPADATSSVHPQGRRYHRWGRCGDNGGRRPSQLR